MSDGTLLDEALIAPITLFFLASILSYHSLRTRKNGIFESVADWLFMLGILLLTVIAMFFVVRTV